MVAVWVALAVAGCELEDQGFCNFDKHYCNFMDVSAKTPDTSVPMVRRVSFLSLFFFIQYFTFSSTNRKNLSTSLLMQTTRTRTAKHQRKATQSLTSTLNHATPTAPTFPLMLQVARIFR